MRRTLGNIANGSVYVLVLALLAGAGGTLLLRARGLEVLSVQSGSMAPAISVGDAVFVRRSPPKLEVGDIVSFISREHGGVVVTHRLIEIDTEAGKLITRGDSSNQTDKPIASRDVIGRVVGIVPYAGQTLDAFKHPLGLALLVYVPAFCIVVSETKRLNRHFARFSKHYYLYSYLR